MVPTISRMERAMIRQRSSIQGREAEFPAGRNAARIQYAADVSDVDVCGNRSLFVQVTVVPLVIVTVRA